MLVVTKKPNEKAVAVEIENGLKPLQDFVGGYIEAVPSHPFSGFLYIINEEGKLEGLKPNIRYGDVDNIVGNLIVCKTQGEEFEGLSEEEAKVVSKYLNELSI